MNKNIYFYSNLFAWGLIIFLITNHVFGWTTPSQDPPQGNVEIETGATPAGSTGHIQFNDNGNLGADSNLFWDNVNKYLGIGTISPGAKLEIQGAEGGSLKFITDVGATGLLEIDGEVNATASLAINGKNIRVADWGFKEAPASWVSEYINEWSRGGGEGNSIDCISSANGCTILQDGTYEIRCVQRAKGTSNTYICISLNGNRSAFESRIDSMWNHSDSKTTSGYTESNFIGDLSISDFITCGALSTTLKDYLSFGTQGYNGGIYIIRIK